MDETRLRQLLSEWMPSDPGDFAAILEQANADSHEGIEWMPRYKAALSCLAHAMGILTGTLQKLQMGLATQPAGAVIQARLAESNRFWEAHLNLVADRLPGMECPPELIGEASSAPYANAPTPAMPAEGG